MQRGRATQEQLPSAANAVATSKATGIKVIGELAGQALHILDRFHIVAKLNKALDEVRAMEYKKLKAVGYEPVLTQAHW